VPQDKTNGIRRNARVRPKIVLVCSLVSILLFSVLFAGVSSGATGSVQANTQTNKYVIFREDDVAPNADFAELQAVNQLNINMNVPVTLGIIPHPYPTPSGNQLIKVNNTFLAYMRSLTSNHLFQFAQHGYTHLDTGPSPVGPSEFYGRPYAAQYDAIKQGRDDITQAFGVTPTSFLPPFDKSDNNTLKAAQALGFTEYSTAFRDFNQNAGSLAGMRLDTISIEIGNNTLQSLENATEQWLNDPYSINTFVVLYHPADFQGPNYAVNASKVTLLANYIDYLQGTGRVQFTTLDRSVTTTGNGTAASSSSEGATAVGATDAPNIGIANAGAVFAVLAAILVVSLASVLTIRRRKNKNRPKG
jgi:peptidoglycan/xylan/chitin deacetylase (PgdA/CDA1 family)